MRRKRAYVEMLKGDIVNLYVAPADREWEAAMTPIRIPIRKGLLNYRILLINKDTAPAFAKVKSNADLMKLQVGLRPGWTTTKIMRALKFNITEGAGYDGLFKMLNANRFDYIPRGNGKFDALFNQAFSKSISRANLPNRKIFNVGNPLLSKQTPLQDETLWFYPFRTN